ncbi:hypothetical protein HMPREF9374_3910 [Desmospora sp. 8437]|nr:hypothetical protein HMPREF9374_3910 [Desmospora sp. 8437]
MFIERRYKKPDHDLVAILSEIDAGAGSPLQEYTGYPCFCEGDLGFPWSAFAV